METTLDPDIAPVVEHSIWKIIPMTLSFEKIEWLWNQLQQYKTVFSDLTRNDLFNFMNALLDKSSVWFEVWEGQYCIGVMWMNELYMTTDARVHMVFFDRKPLEKNEVVKKMIQWAFANFPLNRLTAQMPSIYMYTIKLVERIGFTHEGTKRGAVLIGGKWNDERIYGITRAEVAQWD